jgi:hypothetical protein
MKEALILKTISLHSTIDAVHIESIGFSEDDNMVIEWDARSLMEDIPTLYRMAKQAIEQGEEYELNKYVDFKRDLAEDWKGKRGRKSK